MSNEDHSITILRKSLKLLNIILIIYLSSCFHLMSLAAGLIPDLDNENTERATAVSIGIPKDYTEKSRHGRVLEMMERKPGNNALEDSPDVRVEINPLNSYIDKPEKQVTEITTQQKRIIAILHLLKEGVATSTIPPQKQLEKALLSLSTSLQAIKEYEASVYTDELSLSIEKLHPLETHLLRLSSNKLSAENYQQFLRIQRRHRRIIHKLEMYGFVA